MLCNAGTQRPSDSKKKKQVRIMTKSPTEDKIREKSTSKSFRGGSKHSRVQSARSTDDDELEHIFCKKYARIKVDKSVDVWKRIDFENYKR